jgi:hypothetical protein
MKNVFLYFIVFLLLIDCCNDDKTNLDRLENPSFEDESSLSDHVAASWVVGSGQSPCLLQRADALQGNMPTDGVYYLNLGGQTGPYDENCNEIIVYQEDVDLNGVKKMIFDFYLGAEIGLEKGELSIEILFTSKGTETLWSRSFSNTTTTEMLTFEDKLGESVDLPSLDVPPGRFSIKINQSSGYTTCGGLVCSSLTEFTFHIDNIRFK